MVLANLGIEKKRSLCGGDEVCDVKPHLSLQICFQISGAHPQKLEYTLLVAHLVDYLVFWKKLNFPCHLTWFRCHQFQAWPNLVDYLLSEDFNSISYSQWTLNADTIYTIFTYISIRYIYLLTEKLNFQILTFCAS